MSSKPTILFIHGAWHTPAAYESFLSALRSRGYEVIAPELPSSDFRNLADPPAADISHFAHVARTLADEGKEVVCVMHSYGGAVGTEAMHGLGIEERKAKGLKGGVKRLVYICAFMLQKGKTLEDTAPGIPYEVGPPSLPPQFLQESPANECHCLCYREMKKYFPLA